VVTAVEIEGLQTGLQITVGSLGHTASANVEYLEADLFAIGQ